MNLKKTRTKIKMFKICSNPECSPFAPMTGTILKREYYVDTTELRCKKCKSEYDAEVIKSNEFYDGEHCPRCGGEMEHPKRWWLKCPKCGRHY